MSFFKKLFFAFSLGSVITSAQAHVPIRVVDATAQQWFAGVASAGRTMQYYFTVRLDTKQKIRFDSLWMNNTGSSLEIVPDDKHDTTVSQKNDGCIKLYAEVHTPYGEKGEDSPKHIPAPKRYRGRALMRYFVGDKPYYYIVRTLRKLPDVLMP